MWPSARLRQRTTCSIVSEVLRAAVLVLQVAKVVCTGLAAALSLGSTIDEIYYRICTDSTGSPLGDTKPLSKDGKDGTQRQQACRVNASPGSGQHSIGEGIDSETYLFIFLLGGGTRRGDVAGASVCLIDVYTTQERSANPQRFA